MNHESWIQNIRAFHHRTDLNILVPEAFRDANDASLDTIQSMKMATERIEENIT